MDMQTVPVRVIAVGASAGGLEAIGRLLAHVNSGLGCAFVILQHMSPTHRSMMVELLARDTHLTVTALVDGTTAEADHVYVVPAGSNSEIADGRLLLVPVDPEVPYKPSIDRFFTSLAAECAGHAVGVVLSGTGSDGSAGLRAIVDGGGLAIVQEPNSAKYEGMPASAIESGSIAFVGSPEEIAERLPALLANDPALNQTPSKEEELTELIRLVSAQARVDFSGYKPGTVRRQVQRRLQTTGQSSIAEYLRFVDDHPGELESLAGEMLISVTSFFRDPSAFDSFRTELEQTVASIDPGQPLRAWIAGCATGEEAYTVAMILSELMGAENRVSARVFATDIDEQALATARRGMYPHSALSGIPDALVASYFRTTEDGYEADKRLRDMIVFARHNLVSDPPFLHLNVISCRNVLIYFDTRLQARVLRAFHFALEDDGILFVGTSENPASTASSFTTISRTAHLYRKVPGHAYSPMRLGGPEQPRAHRTRDTASEQLLEAMVNSVGATAILCDADGNVRHSVGDVNRFLTFPQGTTRLTITDILVPELRVELLTMLHQYRTTGGPQRSRRKRVGQDVVRVKLEPLSEATGSMIAIVIVPADFAADHTGEEDSQINAGPIDPLLEDELLSTREHLHALIEEMATSNEEMQALIEESQAANEELQATNEELEASNEELQATNEEVVSLNEGYNIKASELASLSDEYAHLYETLPLSVLVFDHEQRLTRFNEAARNTLGLESTDLGQPPHRLGSVTGFAELDSLVKQAFSAAVDIHSTVITNGRSFQLLMTPLGNNTTGVISVIATFVDVTDVTRAQQQVNDSEARLQSLLEATAVIYAIKSIDGNYVYVNQPYLEAFGLTEAPIGLTDFDFLPSDVAEELWAADLAALREDTPLRTEHAVYAHGVRRSLSSRHLVLRGENGAPAGFVFESIDVTAQHEAEEILRISAAVFAQSGEAIVIADAAGRIQTCNTRFEAITGYSAEEVVGINLNDFLFGSSDEGGQGKPLQVELLRSGHWRGEIEHRRKDGQAYPAWVTITGVTGVTQELEHFVAVFSDNSEMKDVQERTEFLSTHDELTHLPNRALFMQLLERTITGEDTAANPLALLFIDIDHFKNINDMLGHPIGDALLRQVARRIRSTLGEDHTVGRFGGDEFVAVVRGLDHAQTESLAGDLVAALADPYEFDGHDIFSSASVGVAFYPEDGTDTEELLNAADAAMYRAKSDGRDRVAVFHPEIRERLMRDAAIERGLRRSLQSDGYRMNYQPIHRISEPCSIIGLEALLRWEDPQLGPVGPDEFIPVAERCGLIVSVDRLVQGMVLRQMNAWLTDGVPVPRVAINVSPFSLRELDFAPQLLAGMHAAQIPGSLLMIEVTEGALLRNDDVVHRNLTLITNAGVEVAIDDFGVGYSSLSYLRRLPLSGLKIDKSFTAGLSSIPEDRAVALAILSLARSLRLSPVAEGIETEEQRLWLELNGCEYGQGFLLSKPAEPAVIAQMLSATPLPA